MDEQQTVSKRVIDRRAVTTHGFAGAMGLVVGLLFGHTTGTAQDPDRDLVYNVSTAIDRGDDFWASHLDAAVWRRMPHVVLIDHDHGEASPCGRADSTTGPFYCPTNERIYLDLQFLRAIPGELARAYVTAHELGHHVQKMRGEFDPRRSSVSIELGADCYAGLWMSDERQRGRLAIDDIEGALAEASAVGDDRICPTCSTEQWTHGSSEQRAAALRSGLEGGRCDEYRAGGGAP